MKVMRRVYLFSIGIISGILFIGIAIVVITRYLRFVPLITPLTSRDYVVELAQKVWKRSRPAVPADALRSTLVDAGETYGDYRDIVMRDGRYTQNMHYGLMTTIYRMDKTVDYVYQGTITQREKLNDHQAIQFSIARRGKATQFVFPSGQSFNLVTASGEFESTNLDAVTTGDYLIATGKNNRDVVTKVIIVKAGYFTQ